MDRPGSWNFCKTKISISPLKFHLPYYGSTNITLTQCSTNVAPAMCGMCTYTMQITLLLHLPFTDCTTVALTLWRLHYCCTYSVRVELMAGCCRIRSGLMAGSTVSILHVFCMLNHVALPLGKEKNKAIRLRQMTRNKKPRCQRRSVFNSSHLLSRIVFFGGDGVALLSRC